MRPDILVVVEGGGVQSKMFVVYICNMAIMSIKLAEFHKQKWSQIATESLL